MAAGEPSSPVAAGAGGGGEGASPFGGGRGEERVRAAFSDALIARPVMGWAFVVQFRYFSYWAGRPSVACPPFSRGILQTLRTAHGGGARPHPTRRLPLLPAVVETPAAGARRFPTVRPLNVPVSSSRSVTTPNPNGALAVLLARREVVVALIQCLVSCS